MLKKISTKLTCFIAILTILFTGCIGFGCAPQKTDEQLIEERIETFLTSYNNGEYETMMECFEPKTRKQLQTMMDLMTGIAGGLLGVDLNFADLFSLSVTMTKEDFMNLEIYDIDIDDDEATVTTKMDLAGSGSETIYFTMIKENEQWFIKDMNDYVAPSTPPTTPEDDKTNDKDNDEDSDTQTNSTLLIGSPGNFIDDRAWVTYREEETSSFYHGFIDEKGNILYSAKLGDIKKTFNIGKGTGITISDTDCKLINSKGKVIKTISGATTVLTYGSGYAAIYQDKSTITTVEHLYGIIDYQGNWIAPMENLGKANLWEYILHIGNGMFAFRSDYGKEYKVVNMETKSVICVMPLAYDYNISFDNDIAYVDIGNFIYKQNKITSSAYEGEVEVTSDFILYKDGTIRQVSTPKWYSDGKSIIEKDGYYQIIDYTKDEPTTNTFTKYSASMIKKMWFNGDYGVVEIRGVDEKDYFTLINTKGEELYDPICKNDSWSSVYLYQDGNVYWNNLHIDKTGKQTAQQNYYSFSSDTDQEYLLKNYYGYVTCPYYKLNEEQLFSSLKIK